MISNYMLILTCLGPAGLTEGSRVDDWVVIWYMYNQLEIVAVHERIGYAIAVKIDSHFGFIAHATELDKDVYYHKERKA